MPETVGIKYIESLYVIQKKRKFNIAAIAITIDGRKISSSIFATRNDIDTLYRSYDSNIDEKNIDTEISSGVFKLLHYYIPSKEDGMVPMYNLEIGDFKCRAIPSAYEEFAYTLKAAYNSIHEKQKFSIIPKKKKKKGIFE